MIILKYLLILQQDYQRYVFEYLQAGWILSFFFQKPITNNQLPNRLNLLSQYSNCRKILPVIFIFL